MLDINITNQQKQYLLHLLEAIQEQNLTSLSEHFQCSKVNSKKIIDRMVRIGMVYKDKNNIFLTDLGRRIAEEHRDARNDMAVVLHEGLGIDTEAARELANTMLVEESKGMRSRLLTMAHYFVQVERRQGDSLSSDEVARILGSGVAKAYFVVFQDETEQEDNAFVPLSMAQRGFYEDVLITIDESGKGNIALRCKPIEEKMGGTVHRGKPKLVLYKQNGKEMVVPVGDVCRLPFDLIHTWYYTGGGILQACLELCVVPNINIEHRHFAKFVFTINLFNLL